ncbi:MAG: DUF429 domain-containing protein [Phycisphaeraceae bacterium]|nr:DUF429 domain-containing protein [Phycisphaeraceae bacterium]
MDDIIHLFYSLNGNSKYQGSYVVRDPTQHPDSAGAVSHQGNPLSLFEVNAGTTLDQILDPAGYIRDPTLDVFTGWYVEEFDNPDFDADQVSFRGRGALQRFLGSSAAPRAAAPAVSGRGSSSPPVVAVQSEQLRPLPKGKCMLGVDWSGAQNAGNKIWAAMLCSDARGVAELKWITRPFDGRSAAEVAGRFAQWLTEQDFHVAGLDFCFGLSIQHDVAEVPADGPAVLGAWLADRYPNPDVFRKAFTPEIRRRTDRAMRSPFAPTNLRMFRQTYWGIRALTGIQMQIPPWNGVGDADKRSVVEVLPAHVARQFIPGIPYKGPSEAASQNRKLLLQGLVERYRLIITTNDKNLIIGDAEGDAMDALMAAIAAGAALESGFEGAPLGLVQEGWIYSI